MIRLWRARRRHDHVDAVLHRAGSGWELQFLWNDKPMIARRYRQAKAARTEAASKLRELELHGWISHW
jgi:hypothetical protein